MWTQGQIGEHTYSVKHYEVGSIYGINGGRISKLDIRKDGKILVNYDRGWDVAPQGAEVLAVYNQLLEQFN